MAITVPDNMSYGGKKPNFDRDQFATLTAMNGFSSDFLDEGHISYCVETKKHYKWNGTAWVEFKSAGEVADGSITANKLADSSVTEDKLSEDVKSKLNKEASFSGSASDVTYESDSLDATNVQAAIDEIESKKANRDEIAENTENLAQISVVDKTSAQSLALINARLAAVETLLREITNGYYFDELIARKLKVEGSELIKIGSGAPSVQPDFLGQVYIDTTNKKSYTGCGNSAVSDWKANN